MENAPTASTDATLPRQWVAFFVRPIYCLHHFVQRANVFDIWPVRHASEIIREADLDVGLTTR